MASLINILIPVATFYSNIEHLVNGSGMHWYIETLEDEEHTIVKIENTQHLLQHLDARYHTLYLTSEVFDVALQDSFYDDDYCIHAIEVQGGRTTGTELENLGLRIISKTPDKQVRSFFNKLGRHLKNDAAYGIGLEPSSSPLYRNAYYCRESIKGKKLWFDFKRKITPLTVAVT
ncbi:hypothetical protein [Taibaiella chishuiensis]|uniref:Uncharacterized protein n=1 Tax=Taibaiella chishuiensis TaxID=1434707 RepID=A0A2P8CVW2_9BACT|nr:hypothetical protein [Taibaiella chishuiensis]PSK89095.1 hypothetical protein B0I18_113107 [Taibaiella chishuiensis]